MSTTSSEDRSLADSDSDNDDRGLDAGFDAEDLCRYEPGGYHPVHLGDLFNERYKIVHKLGFGGFSTVWLAEDRIESALHRWVALKIVVADHSACVKEKIDTASKAIPGDIALLVAAGFESFTIHGHNGDHICLVLPVLGPSMSQLSDELKFRLHPGQARRAAHLATKALARLHAAGICHGDVTTANFVFGLTDLAQFTEDDIYELFGKPVTGCVSTPSGRPLGLETPRYQVKAVDFLSTTRNIIAEDTLHLIDFDQSFAAHSPPTTMLGTPVEYLAPEVAVGEVASAASDVWSLACTIFRFRSGRTPFQEYEVDSPAELLRVVMERLDQDMPPAWQSVMFDKHGLPTPDASQGGPLTKPETKNTLRDITCNVYDNPKEELDSATQNIDHGTDWADHQPIAAQFAHLGWKLSAVAIDGSYLDGFNDDRERLAKQLPQIPAEEAHQLYDLLRSVFVYDPYQRPTAQDLVEHPWFSIDQCTSEKGPGIEVDVT